MSQNICKSGSCLESQSLLSKYWVSSTRQDLLSLLSKTRRDEARLQKLIFVSLSWPGSRWVERTIKAIFFSWLLLIKTNDVSSGLQNLNEGDNHKDMYKQVADGGFEPGSIKNVTDSADALTVTPWLLKKFHFVDKNFSSKQISCVKYQTLMRLKVVIAWLW